MLIPGKPFPDFVVPTLDGRDWTLSQSKLELTLISVIRGNFCSYCHDGVVELDQRVTQFNDIGIEILVTSTDNSQTAASMVRDLSLKQLRVGFGMSVEDIRRLGLFATERNGSIFAEPAILIARRNGTVYAVFQNSISCGRIHTDRLLQGLQLLAPAGFPLRGNA